MPNSTHPGRRLLVAGLVLGVGAPTAADAAPSALDPSATTTSDACGPVLAKPSGGAWECTFVDDFDGAALDSEKWVTQDTVRTGFAKAWR